MNSEQPELFVRRMLSIGRATKKGNSMNIVKRLNLIFAVVFAAIQVDSFVLADETVTVLMLGDSGLHKPSEFYRHLV
ncbi:MAG: hypothetical protein ACR2NM_01175, partial [Bythopirellula sp.]